MTDYQTKTTKEYKKKYKNIKPFLNERSRRIWAATESESYGWGGVTLFSKVTGLTRNTIIKGIKEIKSGEKIIE